MLLITRRSGEAFQIGPDIEVRVVRSSASRVTFAVKAPKELKVWRTQEVAPQADKATNETGG